MSKVFRIDSISVLHELFAYETPRHPLISVIDLNKINPNPSHLHENLVMGFYSISLKNGIDCSFKYGRQSYDFNEGSMIFMAPGQTTVAEYSELDKSEKDNWMLMFHPELIRSSLLAEKMKDYHFFDYSMNEALQLSDAEKEIVSGIVHSIEREYSGNLDEYSKDLILSNLELLLNHCNRFYGRQFITRSAVNKDILIRFEELLKEKVDRTDLEENGPVTVKQLAEELGYSASYLSDMLKKETGKTTQEHIQLHIIEKAKNLLLGTDEPVYRIAYQLGFEYPNHFSKFFKTQTGKSPNAYRKIG